jgi:gliding motility-associated-like protein
MQQKYDYSHMKIATQTSLKLKLILGFLSLLFVQFSFGQGGPNSPSLDLGDDLLVCAGNNNVTVTALLSNSGGSGASYSWTINGASVSGSTSILTVNASLTAANPQVVACTATLSNNSIISDTLNVYTIDPGTIGSNQFSCSAPYNPSAFMSISNGSIFSGVSNLTTQYQWQSSSNGTSGWNNLSNSNSSTYDALSTSNTLYFRRKLIVTIGSGQNAVSEYCYSNIISVVVLNSPSISSNPCVTGGSSTTMSVNFNPALPSGYTATYTWSGPNNFSSSSATASVANFGNNNVGQYTVSVNILNNGNQVCNYSNSSNLSAQLNLTPSSPFFTLPANGCPETIYSPSLFTPTAGVTYQWTTTPQGGSSTIQTGNNPTFLFNTGNIYTISGTASQSGCTSSPITQTINILNLTNVLPDVAGSTMQVINGVNTFPICSGTSTSTALVYNNNYNNPVNTFYTYTLNNGPATPIDTGAFVPIIYGSNTLVLTATNGTCILTNTVNIYSGSNPYVALGGSNSINLCPGSTVNFTIDPTQSVGVTNPPGTTYSLVFSDASGSMNFTNLINDTLIPHQYLTSSCGVSNVGTTFPNNTYYAVITAQNPCGTTQSFYSPITVHNMPTANFTVSDSTICVGQTITVTSCGSPGSIVGTNAPYTCTTQGKFYWTITGGTLGTNFTIPVGQQLGSFSQAWGSTASNGSAVLNVTFLTAGYYTITQVYYNSCGSKTKIRRICVINPPTSQFTLNPTSGCSPLTVATTNTSTGPACNGTPVDLDYVWTITNPATNATSVISNAALLSPSLSFTNTTLIPQTFNVNLAVIPMEPAAPNIPFSNSVVFCPTAISGSPVVASVAGQSNGSWNGTITGLTGVSGIPAGTLLTATNGTGTTGGSLGIGGTVTVTSTTATSISFNSINGNSPISGPIINLLRASSGTVGAIAGPNANGVWTATITGLCSTTGITVGSVIYASNATGSIGSGGIYTVTAVTANSITYTATGGTTPTAGTITNLAITSCVATSTQSVIVYPEVNFTNAPTATLCSGSTLGLNLTTNVASTFTWVATPNANVSGESTSTQTGSTINDQLVNLTNTPQTVTYTAVATSTVALGSCTKTQTLTITVNPAISLTDPLDLVVCPGVSQAAIAFTSSPSTGVTYNWTNTTTSIGLIGSGTGNIAAFSPVNNTNSNVTATITVTPAFGVCTGAPQIFTITVKPMPTVTGGANQTICLGGSFNAINFSSPTSVANTTYNWTNSNSSIGLASSGSGNIAAITPTSAVSASISVVPTANACNGSAQVFTLVVNPIPIINPIGNQTICSGSLSTLVTFGSNAPNTTYAWTNNNTAIGLAASGSTATIPAFTTTNATNAAISGLITVTPTANGCPGTPITFTITVNPKPTVNAVSSITVCNGAPTGAIDFASTLAVPNTVFNWTNNTTSIGLAASGSGNIASFNAVNTGGANVVATITITPTAGGCNGNVGTFTITVKPTPTATVPGNQSICAGTNSALVTFGSNATGTTYTWTNNNTAIGLGASGSGLSIPAFLATNTSNANISGVITITPTANGCAGTPVSFTITVKPLPTVAAISNLVYCNGASVPSTVFSSLNNVSGATFSWSRPATPSLGLTLTTGTGNLPAFTATNAGTAPILNTITVTSSANACTGPPTSFTITVNPTPTVTVSANATQVKCTGVASNAVTFSGSAVTGTVYNWTNSNTTIGLSASSGSGNIASFTTQNTTNTAQVSTIVVTPTANGCSGTPVTFTITVNPNPQMQNLANVTVCPQSVVPANILSSTVSSSTYSWSVSNNTIGLTPTSGISSTIPSFTAINTGTTPITATVSITPSINLNGQACTGPVGTYTITVNPKPIMQQYNPQLFVFCENNPNSTVNFTSNISSNMSYAWTNDNTSIGLASSGTSTSPNAGISFTALNNTAPPTHQPITSNLTVTPTYVNNGVSCPGLPVPFAITINPLPDVVALQSYTLCATETGSNLYSSFNPIVGLGTTYVWSNSNTAIGMPASGTGSYSFTSTNTTTSPINGTVNVTPTYTNNGVSCTGTPFNFTITVNPMPTVNSIPNQGLCMGSPTTAVTPSGNIPNTVYTWSNNNTSTGLGAGGTTLIPSFTGLNSLNQPNVSTVNVVPSYTFNNHTCTGTAGQFAININPTPNVDAVTDKQFCAQSNASVQFTSTPNIVGTVYNWTNNNTAIGLAASGTGALSFNATNATGAPISATITVTPSFTNAGITCFGTPITFQITILPTPVMSALNSQTICSGNSSSSISFASNLTGTQYAWTNSNTTIGLGASGSGNSIAAFTTSNSGTLPSQGIISVSPSLVTNNQTCIGAAVTATITVNPIPVMNALLNQPFCHGSAASVPFSTSINSGVTYNWSNSNAAIGLGANGSGNLSFTAQNNSTSAISGQIGVTPTYTNNAVQCPGLPATFMIQVAPNPVVLPVSNQVFCNNVNSVQIPITSNVTGTNFAWSNANTSIGLAVSGNGNIPVFNTFNSSTTSVATSLVTVNPTLQYNGLTCSGPSINFSITIIPTATINTVPNTLLCTGQTSLAINFTGTGNAYSWTNSNATVGIGSTGNGTITPFTATNTATTINSSTVTVTSQFTSGGTTCIGNNTTFTIAVLPTPSVIAPSNLTLCNGSLSNAINLTGVATNYSWTNSQTSIGLTNAGSTATIPSFTATNTSPSPVISTVNITPSYVSGTKTCTGTSQSFTITVIPTPNFTSQPQNQTVCIGGALNALSVAYSGGSGVPTYQWYSSSTNNNTTGLPISGATSATYTLPAATLVGSVYYYCELTFANAGTCSVIVSNLAQITITNGPTIASPPLANQSVCIGGTVQALSVGINGGSGTPTYQWYSVSGSTYSPIGGATSISYTPPTFTSAGTYNYAVLVSQGSSGCATSYSPNAQVVVVADPSVSTPLAATYCQNSSSVNALSVTPSNGISAGYTYQWYSNVAANNTNGVVIPGATLNTYVPPVTAVGINYYYCQIQQNPTTSGCLVNSATAAVTVNLGPTISTQPTATQTICVGGTLNALNVAYSGGFGTPTYQWFSNTSNSYAGGTAISSATSNTFNPTSAVSNTAGVYYYYCQITFPSTSGCSLISSNIATVTVLADPVISVSPIAAQTLCIGGSVSPLDFTFTGGPSTSTPSYQWYTVVGSTYTPITTNGTAATYAPPSTIFNAAGTYNYAVSVTQNVSGCASTYSSNAQISIVADPIISSPTGATYCQNSASVVALSTSASNGILSAYNYQWFTNGTTNSNTGGTPIPNATSSTYTPPVNAVGTTYYYCQVTQSPVTNSGCAVNSSATSIIVNLGPTFTTQPSPTQTICVGGTLNALNVAYSGGFGTPTYQWFSNTSNSYTGGTAISSATTNTYNPTTVVSNTAGTFYYYCQITFPSTSGCSLISSNIATVTVLADPVISVSPIAAQTLCIGGSVSPLAFTFTGGPSTSTSSYQWYSVVGSNNTPITTNGTSATYAPPSSIYSAIGTFNYAVVVTQNVSGCASTISSNAQITIVADPTVSAPISANYCQNAGNVVQLSVAGSAGISTPYTYQWFINSTNSSAGGTAIPLETNASFTPPVSATGTDYYYCIVSQAPAAYGCSVSSSPSTITVTPAPTFTTQPTASQSVCVGGTLSALTVAYSGGSGTPTYQWFSNSSNSYVGGNTISSATAATFTPPAASTPGTMYYYCQISFVSNSGCSQINSNIAQITVVADPVISVQPTTTQSICLGGTTAAPFSVSYANGLGTVSYQWYSVSGTTNTLIPSATAASYTPPVLNTAGTYNYMVQINLSGNGCNQLQSTNAQVVVVADPAVTNPVGASYCLNSSTAVTLSITASGGITAPYTYQWFATNLNNNTSGSPITGATSSGYIPPATTIGTTFYYCVVSQGVGCSVSTQPAGIIITAAPSFSSQPMAAQNVCVDGTLTPLSVSFIGGSGTPSYQWYSNSLNATIGGVAINGATNQSYTPSTALAGTTYFYCVVTFTLSGCSSITSNIGQVIVFPDPVVTTQPLNTQTICGGGSIPNALNVAYSGGTGTLSYQWFNVNGSTNTAITGASSVSYLPPAFTTPGTYNYAVQISLSGSGCGMVQSNNAQVIVLPDPTVTAPISATYCNGYAPVQALSVTANGGISAAYTYQWYSNALNSNTTGTLITGATSSTFTPSVTTSGLVYYYCIVSQGAANTGCSISSATALITTTPAPAISAQPTNLQTACVGGTLNNLTVSYTGANTSPSYQWYSNTSNANTGGTPIPGANAASYLPPNSTAGTNYYYCVISFPSIGCTTISSNPGAVTIHPDPIISTQPITNQAICFGTTLNAPLNISYTGGFGTASYQWNLVNGANSTPIITATNASYLPSNYNVADTFYYNVTLSLSGNGCNSQTSNLAEVIVIPVPVIDSVQSYLYCNADTADMVVFSGPIPGTTYIWENDNINIGLDSMGFGNIMPFEVTNLNNNGIVGNITVTPQLTSLSTTCSGLPIDFMIMANPYQDVQDPTDLILCHGQGLNGVQFFGTALINNWTNDQPALGIPSSGSGTLPAFLAVNNGTQPIVANLSVTPTFNAVTTCPGDIETFTITILPSPNANALPVNQLVCSGDLSTTINISGTATSFTWTNNQTSTGLAASGTGNIPAFLTTATGSNTTSTIAVTPVYTMNNVSCPGPVQNVQITVVPTPSVLPIQDIVLCSGEATGLIQILGNANQLNWTSSNPIIGTAALGIGSIPSFNVINTGQNPISTVITITPVNFFGGLTCMAPAENFSITVNPTPTIAAIPDLVLCSQVNSPVIIFSGNANSYSWTNSNTAIGVSASGTGNISSFTSQNALPSVISSVINVTPAFTNAGLTCQGTPESFVIDVLPQPSVDPINAQTICNSSATAPIIFTGNATAYNWINNNASIGIASIGTGNIPSFNTVAGATTNVANIVVTPTYVYNNTVCSGTPLTTTITVLPSPFINNVQDFTACNGTLSGVLAFSGTASAFNWTNSNPSIGLSSNGSGNLPVFTYANTSSNPLQATITVVPQTGQGNQVCLGSPEIFTITVNPTPSMLVPSNQVLCSQTQSLPVNFSGNATNYSWINSNTSIGLPSFGNGSIPAFVTQNNGTATATAQIQVTPQYINAGATCFGPSQNFTISVDPIPSIQYSQIGQAICTGSSTNAINLSSTTSGVTFSWNILNPSGSISGISSMNGTGNIPSLTLVNSSNSSAQFNFQGIATTNLAACEGLGPIGTITVDPAPILQPLNDLTICSNDNVNDTLNASIPSTYSWSASSNTNISGQSIGVVNSNLIYNTLLNNSAVLQYITYTVTPTSFPLGCIGTPEDFVVEVVPNIQITSPLNFEICSGEPTDITLQSNFPGTFTFVANNNTNVQGETSVQQTGFYINDILSNTSSYDQVVSYNVQVSANPYGCFGIPQVVNVEVHPEISITNVSPTQMCSGAPLNLTLTATENATFSWYATQNAIVTGESTTTQTSPILNDALLNNSNAWQQVIYTLSATSTVTGCDAQALPLSIIVNPIPVVSSLPDSVYCSGESTDPLNWTLNGTATNYAWVNTNSSIGLPLNGNGNIPAFTVLNLGPQTVVSTITVTPQYINNGFVCAGTPDQLTITVEPIPNISYSIPNQSFCSGDTSGIVVISSTTNGVNTTWQLLSVPNTIIGDPTMPIIPSGLNQIPAMILSNMDTIPQQISFQGTVSTPLNGCTTVGPIGQIVVQPEPVINNVNDSTICNNGVVTVNIDASIPSTYSWSAQSNPNVNGESVGPVNSNFIYNALQNTSSTIQYVNYTITPTSISGSCVGLDQDFTIEVIPDIVIDTQLTSLFDSICSGEQTSIYLQTNLPATITWHGIDNPNVLGETTTPTTGFYISDVLINNTPFNQYVNYSIDMISSPYGCFGIPEVITMQVFPAIQLTNATNINLCSGDQLDINLAATVNATFTWSATNNGVVQGESITSQNTSILNDLLINNSAQSQQVFYSVDVVANNSSCQAFDLPVTVNVLPLPLLQNDDTTICSGEYTQINLVTNIPSNVIWNGVFNMDIQGETTANISGNYINDFLVNNSGQDDTLVYQIQAIANGCPAPLDSVLVIVHDQPDVDFIVTTAILCTDNQVQFTNLSSPLFDYDWTFGDGGSSVVYSPAHIYTNSGLYEVMLIATNPLNNCTAADSVNVIINKSPDASFYTMDTIGCGDLNATFFANYQANSDMVWDFGDGQTLTQVGNVTNYYGQAGCYDVTLTVTSPEGCVEQETYDDYVCVYEDPIAFIGASPMSVNALEPTVQFSNSSQNAISYMWQMGDGSISYDDNPTYTYPMEGADYYVLMTAYNEVGCFDTASVSIHVYEDLIYYVPNTFTPNDDEKNQTFYPVLSQGMKKSYVEFYIYNRWGELVFESHDPKYGWDGTYGPGALDCPIGTYTWRLKLETLQTQEILEFRGHVNLVR